MSRSAYSAQPSPLPETQHIWRCHRLSSSGGRPSAPTCRWWPGHALVVDGGHLPPRAELRDAGGHRPPHPPRTAEVLARAGVVDAAVLGGRDAALDPAHRLRDVEVRAGQLLDGAVGERCIQSRNASLPSMCRAGSASRCADGLLDRPAGQRAPRRSRPSPSRSGAAPPSPTRRSRRGRPRRRGSSATPAGSARARRRPAPGPAAPSRRPGSRPNSANAPWRAAAPLQLRAQRSLGGGRHERGKKRGTSACPVHPRTCAATSTYWRRADTGPGLGGLQQGPSIALQGPRHRGRAGVDTSPQPASVEVSMRSKTERTSWRPLTITETSDCGIPASARSIETCSRSRNASWAAPSRSSHGVAALAAASVGRPARSARRTRRGRGRSAGPRGRGARPRWRRSDRARRTRRRRRPRRCRRDGEAGRCGVVTGDP